MKASYYLRAQNFAAPSVVANTLSFRGEDVHLTTNNIMFDSRVYRGNTYARPVLTEDQRRNQKVFEHAQLARRRRRIKANNIFKSHGRPGTPPPVEGRSHVEVQTMENIKDILHCANKIKPDHQVRDYLNENKDGKVVESVRTINNDDKVFDDAKIYRDKEEHDFEHEIYPQKKPNNSLTQCEPNDTKLNENLTQVILEESTKKAIEIFEEKEYFSDSER